MTSSPPPWATTDSEEELDPIAALEALAAEGQKKKDE